VPILITLLNNSAANLQLIEMRHFNKTDIKQYHCKVQTSVQRPQNINVTLSTTMKIIYVAL